MNTDSPLEALPVIDKLPANQITMLAEACDKGPRLFDGVMHKSRINALISIGAIVELGTGWCVVLPVFDAFNKWRSRSLK